METKLVRLNELSCAEYNKILGEAGDLLRLGELVAFPTETVYGLGGNGLDADGAAKIYSAKGRPSDNPLIVHIADLAMAEELMSYAPLYFQELVRAFWPGPLTLIVPKSDKVPLSVTGGLDTVALRMPDNKVALDLIRAAGVPVAAPSANISGRPSTTTGDHVYEDLKGKIPLILDGGATEIGLESTILDLSSETPVILRPGKITFEELRQIIPNLQERTALKEGERPKAPGMKYKHYAPKGEVFILPFGDEVKNALVKALNTEDKKGFLLTDEDMQGIDFGDNVVINLGSREEQEVVAHNLFAALRRCDDLNVEKIYISSFEEKGLGEALMNRIGKAGTFWGTSVNNEPVKKITFVCTGNTCRSPMAEYLARYLADKSWPGLELEFNSAGIYGVTGAPPSDGSVAALAELGIDLKNHRAVAFSPYIGEESDLILTMTAGHKQLITMMYPDLAAKAFTLGEFSQVGGDVGDPFGGDLEIYRDCRNQIEDMVKKALLRINSIAKK